MPSLLSIPFELRRNIWSHALDLSDPSNTEVKGQIWRAVQIHRIKALQLLYVSRDVYRETSEVLYKINGLVRISSRRCVLLPATVQHNHILVLSCHHDPDKAIYSRHACHIHILPGPDADCGTCHTRAHSFDLTIPMEDLRTFALGFALEHVWRNTCEYTIPKRVHIDIKEANIFPTHPDSIFQSWTLAKRIEYNHEGFSVSYTPCPADPPDGFFEEQLIFPQLLYILRRFKNQSKIFALLGHRHDERNYLSLLLTCWTNVWKSHGDVLDTLGDEVHWEQLQQLILHALVQLSYPNVCKALLKSPEGSPVPILDALNDVDTGILILRRIIRYIAAGWLPGGVKERKAEIMIALGAALKIKNVRYAREFWGEFLQVYGGSHPRYRTVHERFNGLEV